MHLHTPLSCRVSFDALYSVRLTSPEDNDGYHPGVFPVSVTNGTTYQLSAYLYAAVPGITVQFSVTGPLVPQSEFLPPSCSLVNP